MRHNAQQSDNNILIGALEECIVHDWLSLPIPFAYFLISGPITGTFVLEGSSYRQSTVD